MMMELANIKVRFMGEVTILLKDLTACVEKSYIYDQRQVLGSVFSWGWLWHGGYLD